MQKQNIYIYEYAMYTISFYSQIKRFKVSDGPQVLVWQGFGALVVEVTSAQKVVSYVPGSINS